MWYYSCSSSSSSCMRALVRTCVIQQRLKRSPHQPHPVWPTSSSCSSSSLAAAAAATTTTTALPTLHCCYYSSATRLTTKTATRTTTAAAATRTATTTATTAVSTSTSTSSKSQAGGLFSILELQQPRDFLHLATKAQHECNSLRRDIQNAVQQQQQQLDNVHTARQLLFQLDAISRAVCNVIDAAELARHVHICETWRQAAEQAFEVLSDYMAQLNSDPYLYQAVKLVTNTRHIGDNNDNSKNNRSIIWDFLREEEQRFAVLLQAEFERDGIHLPDQVREKVRQIQGHLTELETMFSRNVITCQSDFVVENGSAVYDVLPKHVLASLGIVEEQDKYDTTKSAILRLPNNSPTPILQTLLKYSADPALRKHIYMQAMTAVPENLPVLDALRQTRHELATTLGFESYAQRFLRDQMAQTPAAVQDFLQRLQTKLQPVYQQQLGQLQQAKRIVESSTEPVRAWDMSFYTCLLQSQGGEGKDVSSAVAPYFTLNHCLASMPVLVDKLFGIEMREEEHLTANEKWDVRDASKETSQIRKFTFSGPDGRPLGTLYLDLHSRPGKYNHAAHFTVRCGCRTTPFLETESSKDEEDDYGENYQLPIVTLVCNLSSGPTLSHGEVETLFHEFGHALHSLLSRTEFQHMSGTRAAMDFVETPSHLIENFVWDADFLKLLGVHHVTGEVMPDQLIEALRQSRNSFAALERQNQILYAKLDQTLFGVPDPSHRTTTQIFADLHHEAGVPYAEGTHWHSRFGHLVTYGAGYYGYLYAQVFAGDLWKALFEKRSLERASGDALWHGLLQHGGARDPHRMLKELLGRPPCVESFAAAIASTS